MQPTNGRPRCYYICLILVFSIEVHPGSKLKDYEVSPFTFGIAQRDILFIIMLERYVLVTGQSLEKHRVFILQYILRASLWCFPNFLIYSKISCRVGNRQRLLTRLYKARKIH